MKLVKISAISIQSIIINVVTHIASSQKDENVINKNIEEEWANY